MKKLDPQWNERVLEAWEEWKEICFVGGCSSESEQLLNIEIYSAFRRKFYSLFPVQTPDILRAIYSGRDCTREDFPPDDGRYESREDDAESDDAEYPLPRDEKDAPASDDADDDADDADDNDADDNDADDNDADDNDADDNDADDNDADDGAFDSEFFRKVASMWATEFDLGVIKTPPPRREGAPEDKDAEITDLQKRYKDFLWTEVRNSKDDSPLKVIRGKLTGPHGIINGIAESYLQLHHPVIWENYKEYSNNQARKYKRDMPPIGETSLDTPIGEDGGTLGDVIPDPGKNSVCGEDPASVEKWLNETFSVEEIALIFATAANIKTDLATQRFLGRGHDSIARMWNDPKHGLRKKFHDCAGQFNTPGAVFFMKKRLEAEKNADPFLKKLEGSERIQQIFSQAEEYAIMHGLKS